MASYSDTSKVKWVFVVAFLSVGFGFFHTIMSFSMC